MRAKLQLVGVGCMLIAAKYEEIYAPQVEEFCYITDNTYDRPQVLSMERQVGGLLRVPSAPAVLPFQQGSKPAPRLLGRRTGRPELCMHPDTPPESSDSVSPFPAFAPSPHPDALLVRPPPPLKPDPGYALVRAHDAHHQVVPAPLPARRRG